MCLCAQRPEASDLSGFAVTGVYEPPEVGTGYSAHVYALFATESSLQPTIGNFSFVLIVARIFC